MVLILRVAAPSRFFEGAEVFFSNEFVSDETQEKPRPRPFKAERVGHPEKLDQSLGVDVLEWYNPVVSVRQQEIRKGGPPAKTRIAKTRSHSSFLFVVMFDSTLSSGSCNVSVRRVLYVATLLAMIVYR